MTNQDATALQIQVTVERLRPNNTGGIAAGVDWERTNALYMERLHEWFTATYGHGVATIETVDYALMEDIVTPYGSVTELDDFFAIKRACQDGIRLVWDRQDFWVFA